MSPEEVLALIKERDELKAERDAARVQQGDLFMAGIGLIMEREELVDDLKRLADLHPGCRAFDDYSGPCSCPAVTGSKE